MSIFATYFETKLVKTYSQSSLRSEITMSLEKTLLKMKFKKAAINNDFVYFDHFFIRTNGEITKLQNVKGLIFKPIKIPISI